ncbi:MAG: type III pantothenate kinase [Bacteroidales bacterium]|nr:type III pantothenate kinase [Bacteroidales bacterium]
MNLLIDIGNSSVKAAFANGKELSEVHICRDENVEGFIRGLIKNERPQIIALSSVRRPDKDFLSALESLSDCLLVVKGDSSLPVRIEYLTPETLGADRICAAIGSAVMYPDKDLVIFDFGTALTIDHLSASGVFRGGNISLGLKTRFRALSDYTQLLPLIETPDKIENIGRSTKEAIESGIILGMLYEIEGYINRYPDCIHIFTGGDAIYFAEKMKRPIFVVYNLVLMGLAHIANYHAKT